MPRIDILLTVELWMKRTMCHVKNQGFAEKLRPVHVNKDLHSEVVVRKVHKINRLNDSVWKMFAGPMPACFMLCLCQK